MSTKEISNFKFFFLKLYYSIRFIRYIRSLLVIKSYFYDSICIFRAYNDVKWESPLYCWDSETKRWEQIA